MSFALLCTVCHESAVAPVFCCSRRHIMCYGCLVQYFNSKYPECADETYVVLPCPMCREAGPRCVAHSSVRGFEPLPGKSPCLVGSENRLVASELRDLYGTGGLTPSWWRCGACRTELPPLIVDAYRCILECPAQLRVCHRSHCRHPEYQFRDGYRQHKLKDCTEIRCRLCQRRGTFVELQSHFRKCQARMRALKELAGSVNRLVDVYSDGNLDDNQQEAGTSDLLVDGALVNSVLAVQSLLMNPVPPKP